MGSSNGTIVIISMMAITIVLSPHLSQAHDSPREYVHAHNLARAQLGLPPVEWDETLAHYAREYAHKRSADCHMEHSNGQYGENLAEGSWDLSPQEAVDLWTVEKKFYDTSSNACVGGECLHYTQVVWRDSTHIGCAKTKCQNGWTFVTCNYYPPGNYIGERPY